jgi:hypothetical protein
MSHQPPCLGPLPGQLFYLSIQVIDLFLGADTAIAILPQWL